MIPLNHIITFLDFLAAFPILLVLLISYRKNRDAKMKNFIMLFFGMSVYFLLISIQALFNSREIVQIINIVGYPFLFLGAIAILLLLKSIFHFKIISFLLPFFILSSMTVFTLHIVFFAPAEKNYMGSFWDWMEGTPPWLQATTGVLIGFTALLCAILFFIGGFKTDDKTVRYRAFFIGWGLLLFLFASVSYFVSSAYAPNQIVKFIEGTIAVSSIFFGFFLIFLGTRYNYKKPKSKQKI